MKIHFSSRVKNVLKQIVKDNPNYSERACTIINYLKAEYPGLNFYLNSHWFEIKTTDGVIFRQDACSKEWEVVQN